ncbi:MAG: hypothetical protein QME58_10835, partial [Bacteroidota bacterium]|nr:hypothetical protein [Bacteroidota bacterium]
MVEGRILVKYLLQNRFQKPFWGTIINFVYSLGLTLLVLAVSFIFNKIIDQHYFLGIFLISSSLFFFGWATERLWYATISKMMANPFSFWAFFTRIPFWFIGGGMGFSISSLLAYKFGLVYISVVPQSNLFLLGGILECILQIPIQIIWFRFLIKGQFQKFKYKFSVIDFIVV